jgi:hypothetical protein
MAAEGQCRTIFISYRRDDSEGEAGRLYDDLARAYGDDSVFMDVSGIQPGVDFRKAIDDNVANCGVLLAVIGLTWATVTGRDGTRRLDNPDDYVRLEIGTALKRGVPVIPVLVHEAHMPALEQLPEDLKDLRYRNSVELTHARWASDVALLVTALKSYVSTAKGQSTETVHATVPVQLPAPQAAPVAPVVKKSQIPLFAGIAVLGLLILAGAGYAWMRHGETASSATLTPASTPGSTPAATTAAAPAQTTQPAATTTPAPVAAPPVEKPVLKPVATPTMAPVATPTAPATRADASAEMPMLGRWSRQAADIDKANDGLVQLSIVEFGGQIMVRGFGQCQEKLCDWGMRKATLQNGFWVTEQWQPRTYQHETDFQRRVSASMAISGGKLMVTIKNQTIDPDRGPMFSLRQVQYSKAQ